MDSYNVLLDNRPMKVIILIFLLFFVCFSQANILGSDTQNFNPTSNGLDFITVHSSRTLDPFEFNFGAFTNYSTNSLPYSTVSTRDNIQSFTEVNDQIIHSYLHASVGIIEGWDLGVNASFMNSQTFRQSDFVFTYGDPGVDDIRFNSKFRIINEEKWGGALILSMDFDQIQNNPFVGENPGPTINIEGAVDVKINERILWAANLGYRLRNEGTPIANRGIIPISDQIIYSTALSYLIGPAKSAFVAELFGAYPLDQPPTVPTDRQLSNLESLFAYKWRALQKLDVIGGMGGEVYHGLGSPDFRAFLGLNFRWGVNEKGRELEPNSRNKPIPRYNRTSDDGLREEPNDLSDGDNDGVPDYKDKCPNTWNQNYVGQNGCASASSDSPKESTDSDSDGIDDIEDRCPQTSPGARVNAYGCEIPNY